MSTKCPQPCESSTFPLERCRSARMNALSSRTAKRLWRFLRARIYEAEQRRKDSEITASRRAQVGTGERAEKIRTYNFPQDRITDHRISSSFHGIQQVLDGGVDEIIEALGASERTALLEQALT